MKKILGAVTGMVRRSIKEDLRQREQALNLREEGLDAAEEDIERRREKVEEKEAEVLEKQAELDREADAIVKGLQKMIDVSRSYGPDCAVDIDLLQQFAREPSGTSPYVGRLL